MISELLAMASVSAFGMVGVGTSSVSTSSYLMLLAPLLLMGKGILIGFSIAAPVGPIGLLCFQRSLHRGWLQGVFAGLGAACADALYGCLAAIGLLAINDWISSYQAPLTILGALFIGYLGVRTLRSSAITFRDSSVPELPGTTAQLSRLSEGGKGFGITFFLTLTNPMTILAFLAIFSSVGVQGQSSQPWWLVLGVFLGSVAWWLLLCTLASRLRSHLSARHLDLINRLSGSLLLLFAGVTLLI